MLENWLNSTDAKILEQANRLIFAKQYPQAKSTLEPLIEDVSENANLLAHIRYIELLTKEDGVSPHCSLLKEKLKNHPSKKLELIILLCNIFDEKQSYQEGIDSLHSYIKENGKDAVAYYGIGHCLENIGELKRAQQSYEQSLSMNPKWYPSLFGISQVNYKLGNDSLGDQYFYLFEEQAPYNVYGNFITHRQLYKHFLENDQYKEAETAITTLSNWWVQNKGLCPLEIKIFEDLSIAKIAQIKKDEPSANKLIANARTSAHELLSKKKVEPKILFFTAKILEEHQEKNLAYSFYKKVLSSEMTDPVIIQRIGSQFLTNGEHEKAETIFSEAYEHHPDNSDIRFCLLVSKLKNKDVDVEEYLRMKEKMRKLIKTDGDKVELLAILHSLLAKFQEDAEVQACIGDIYWSLKNPDRTHQHYKKMYSIEPKTKNTLFKYIRFLQEREDHQQLAPLFSALDAKEDLTPEEYSELNWLKSNYLLKTGQYKESLQLLKSITSHEPWNLSFILQNIWIKTTLAKEKYETVSIDEDIKKLQDNSSEDIDWTLFNAKTKDLENSSLYELCYLRNKVYFLYNNEDASALTTLVESANIYDVQQGIFDLMKLINTNYDLPQIYWAIGLMYKDLWQHQTARMWFDQTLRQKNITAKLKAKVYLDIGECFIWEKKNINKALEFLKLSLELGNRNLTRTNICLAHGYLCQGELEKARSYLERIDQQKYPEAAYLSGLISYRNGEISDAKSQWKPLITMQSSSLKFYNIKNDILQYYFDKKPYLNMN